MRGAQLKVIEDFSDLDKKIEKVEIKCCEGCSYFKEDEILKGACPYSKYSRGKTIKINHKFTDGTLLFNVIKKSAGELLINIKLFDKFIKDDKISYAFNLVFQSQEKTLSDKEVNKIMDKITGALNSNSRWEVR